MRYAEKVGREGGLKLSCIDSLFSNKFQLTESKRMSGFLMAPEEGRGLYGVGYINIFPFSTLSS